MSKKSSLAISASGKTVGNKKLKIEEIISEMQQISQTLGVTKYLYLQDNHHGQMDNLQYRQDYCKLVVFTDHFHPKYQDYKRLLKILEQDIGNVAAFEESLFYKPMRELGIKTATEIARYVKETSGDFSPLTTADLMQVYQQQEKNNQKRYEILDQKEK